MKNVMQLKAIIKNIAKKKNISAALVLNAALKATTEKRGSTEPLNQYREIMQVMKNSDVMKRQWDNYRKDFDYASGIEFEETCDAVVAVMDRIYT